ncbi:MAG TPA: hypothetical protein DIW54_13040 [Chitinophagaceae bacterium]|nr:hypothetical protein [Chitinophagaceae bacterium]
MQQKTLLYKLTHTKFGLEFIKALAPITGKHLKLFLKNPTSNFGDFCNEKEKKLKEISHYYNLLQTAVSDLDIVLTFLKIEDRKAILQIFPTLESQEQYYRYHLENFIIRIITITDIIGKLGNSIFETGIPEEKCNGYTFKEKIKTTDLNCSALVERLLLETKEIKDKRHNKIHTGVTKIGYLEGIVFWDELTKIIESEADPILEVLTDTNIQEEIELLEKDIRYVIDLVIDFTDYATDKFIEISNR